MDTRRLIVVMVLGMGLMLLWMAGVEWLGQRLGYIQPPQEEVEVEEAPELPELPRPALPPDLDEPSPETPAEPVTPPPVDPADPSDARPQPPEVDPDAPLQPELREPAPRDELRVLTEAEPTTIQLGSAEADHPVWAMQLELTNVGGGIDLVTLNRYRLELDSEQRFVFQSPHPGGPAITRPFSTRQVELLGRSVRLDAVPWAVSQPEGAEDREVTFYVEVGTDDGPLVRVSKTYRLYERDEWHEEGPDPREGYEILLREEVRNVAAGPVQVRTRMTGPTAPPRELEYGYDRSIITGYRGRYGRVIYDARQVERIDSPRGISLLKDEDDPPLLWAGTSSIYFNAIVRPMSREGVDVPRPEWLEDVRIWAANPQSPREERHVSMEFVTAPQELGPGDAQQFSYRIFLGPKRRDLLRNDYYSGAGYGYHSTLVSPFGCTWCVFQPVVDVLVWLLSGFFFLTRDWGLAIIGLVVLVRLLLHPITKKAQMSMMRLSKLGPEIEKIKKKYGDDKEKMAQAMQEFYREHGMAALPMGCLPMLLQMPIWIALYSMLQAEFGLRHAPFLYGWTWINDLAKPDHLIQFENVYRVLILPPITGLNLLPLLMGVIFFINIKLQPQPAALSPEQRMQQKMIMWMMILVLPIFLYSAPSGLNLYILTSTFIGIFETRRIRAQYNAKEEAEKAAQPTLVKEKAGRSKREAQRQAEKPKPQPRKGLSGWFANLQEGLQKRVEDAQKEASRRAAQKGKR